MNLIVKIIGAICELLPIILENHLQPISFHGLFLLRYRKKMFSGVFREFRKRPVAWNGLICSKIDTQLAITCLKLAIGTLEQGVKYVKSHQ